MSRISTLTNGLVLFSVLFLVGSLGIGCNQSNLPEPESPAGVTPFSITARVQNSTVAEVTAAIAEHIHTVDDTESGLVSDWILAGGEELEHDEPATEAVLNLPDGSRIIEVCNRHYATMAMSFGGHHGVALPCEISVSQVGEDVEVVLLNPEAIFGVFFGDIPAEAAEQMGGVASAVRVELEDLIRAGLNSFDAEFPGTPVGPVWTPEVMEGFRTADYSIEMDFEIPEQYLDNDETRQAFKQAFIEGLLETLTFEGMERVGSQVPGLSVSDWRSARPHSLNLPGQISIVEVCSPTYATAALGSGTHHAPALPCEIAIWVDGDTLRVHILDPTFILPTFFGDAPEEMMSEMGGLADSVQSDLRLIVSAAQESLFENISQ